MGNLYKAIETLCAEKGETIADLCRATGITHTTMSNYKTGRQKSLSPKAVQAISEHFGISIMNLENQARIHQAEEESETNIVYKRVESLCRDKGETVTDMCRDTNISRTRLSELKTGRTQRLSTEILQRIAEYFGVSVDYLLNGTKNPPADGRGTISDTTRKLYDIIDTSTEEDRKLMLEMIEVIKRRGK